MTIISDLMAGYEAGCPNDAPVYPNAVWPQRIETGEASIEGFDIEMYFRNSRRSIKRLFDVDFTSPVEDGLVVLYPLAINDETGLAFLNKTLWFTCQATETSTGHTYILIEGLVRTGVGSIPKEVPEVG